jgi:hypothetical protein
MNNLQRINTDISNNIDAFITMKNLQELLRILNIESRGSININKEITINPVTKSILIEIPKNESTDEKQILLCHRKGLPIVDQVYSAIYKEGSDCQQRIIAFTDGHCWDDHENPGADIDKVRSLIETMNEYNQNIHLVKMSHDSTGADFEYEILAHPTENPKYSKVQCPTIEQFTEAELWQIHFWPPDDMFQELAFQSEFDTNREYGVYFEFKGLGIDTKWDDTGALILVTDNNTKGNTLEHLWNNKKDEIMDMFRGCEILLLYSSGRIEKISITVFNKPIGDLAGAMWKEKSCYAGLLYSKYMKFEDFFEKALQDFTTARK